MAALFSLTTGVVYATKVSGSLLVSNGSATAPSIAFASNPRYGIWKDGSSNIIITSNGTAGALVSPGGGIFNLGSTEQLGWAQSGDASVAPDTILVRDAANTLALKNGTNAQAFLVYGYSNGSRLAYGAVQTVTAAVTLSGASTATSTIIPAGATVLDVATTTTTAITGATGYQVGDGTTATRYGNITGTAVGTNSGSTSYTTDPRWWSASARAITLTAKTSNFTAGVVQVVVVYTSATGA